MILRLILLFVVMLSAGCGQTGDLYWPDKEKVIIDDDESEER